MYDEVRCRDCGQTVSFNEHGGMVFCNFGGEGHRLIIVNDDAFLTGKQVVGIFAARCKPGDEHRTIRWAGGV
jgi:hypothetical protein